MWDEETLAKFAEYCSLSILESFKNNSPEIQRNVLGSLNCEHGAYNAMKAFYLLRSSRLVSAFAMKNGIEAPILAVSDRLKVAEAIIAYLKDYYAEDLAEVEKAEVNTV